jgi:ADP-ribose pyrophosphatase YjhB (NUDIX family)
VSAGNDPAATVRLRVSGLVVRSGRLLAVRHRKEGRSYYLLPGGGVDVGERLPACLEREFAEELGVTACAGALLLACDSISPERGRHIVHLVFATRIQGEPRATGRDPRVAGSAWLDAAELAAAEFHPDIKAWLAVRLARGPAGAAGAAGAGDEGASYLAPEWVP